MRLAKADRLYALPIVLKNNLPICHRCQPGQGTCHVNGRDIRDNAREGQCPKGEFGQEMTLAEVAHGVAGLVKVAIGRDRASDELIAQREAICAECNHAVMRLGLFHQCDICKCATGAKVRLKGEHCPLTPPKW